MAGFNPGNRSLMMRLGYFTLTLEEITENQQMALDIFSQCIILDARPPSPRIYQKQEATDKIIYLARSHWFDELESYEKIPAYTWTLEEVGEDQAEDFTCIMYKATRIDSLLLRRK